VSGPHDDGPEPDDPFERLLYHWGRAYAIIRNEDGSIMMSRRDDGAELPAALSEAEARRLLRGDYSARPVASVNDGPLPSGSARL
jgi:hypothetical protein